MDKRNLKSFVALEMVFIILILIVVVIVVVQMFRQYVNPKKVSSIIEDITQSPKYDFIKRYCDNLCEKVKLATTYEEKISYAYDWCTKKIVEGEDKGGVDINNDGNYRDLVIIRNYPYCENALYCFHFSSCNAEGLTLSKETCGKVICEYFVNLQGEEASEVSSLIADGKVIETGNCGEVPEKYAGKVAADSPDWWFERFFSEIDCEELLGYKE